MTAYRERQHVRVRRELSQQLGRRLRRGWQQPRREFDSADDHDRERIQRGSTGPVRQSAISLDRRQRLGRQRHRSAHLCRPDRKHGDGPVKFRRNIGSQRHRHARERAVRPGIRWHRQRCDRRTHAHSRDLQQRALLSLQSRQSRRIAAPLASDPPTPTPTPTPTPHTNADADTHAPDTNADCFATDADSCASRRRRV